MSKRKETPAIQEMKDQIEECRQELLNLLADWHYLKNILQPQLLFTYDSIFGDLEEELNNKSFIASELDRRVEVLSIKIRRGEKLTEKTINFLNMFVGRDVIQNSNEFNNHYNNLENGFKIGYNYDSCEINDKYEIPQLYRQIVKKLHPDVSGDTDNFQKFWDNIQDAYKSRDIKRLRLFHQTLCKDVNFEFKDLKAEENALKMEIKDLEKNINSEKFKITQLKKQEPYVFQEKLNDELWISKRKRQLREQIFKIDRQIQHQRRLLISMTKDHLPVHTARSIWEVKEYGFAS